MIQTREKNAIRNELSYEMSNKSKTLTLKEIRERMLKFYGTPKEIIRPMNIDMILNNYGEIGTVLFSLNGSPPKGYGIYLSENCILYFYGTCGERGKKMEDVRIPQIDSLIEKEKYKPTQYIFGGDVGRDPEKYGSLAILPNLE